LDTAAQRVMRAGVPVELTRREYQLLEYLMRRGGEVVSRTEIEEHIYDDLANPVSNVVDSAICALRRKLSPPGSPAIIHTRRGSGYVLEVS
jgi:DNA-binding response OmpR family regulator